MPCVYYDIPGPQFGPMRVFKDDVTGRTVYIPQGTLFTIAALACLDGARLSQAYYDIGYDDFIPDTLIAPCIKLHVFQGALQYVGGKQQVMPFGDWVNEKVCMCLEQIKQGSELGKDRIKIADNVYIPSPAEQACITSKIASGRQINEAFYQCGGGNIMPYSSDFGACIGDLIKNTNYPYYYDYTICMQKYPPADQAPEKPENSKLIIVISALALLLMAGNE